MNSSVPRCEAFYLDCDQDLRATVTEEHNKLERERCSDTVPLKHIYLHSYNLMPAGVSLPNEYRRGTVFLLAHALRYLAFNRLYCSLI